MDESVAGELARRVEALEAEVEEQGISLRRQIRRLESMPLAREPGFDEMEQSGGASVMPSGVGSEAEAFEDAGRGRGEKRAYRLPFDLEWVRSGEWWLNKVGVGLLLFGVAFLFKFSIDRGWITPPVRVGVGLAIAASLVALGLRICPDRRAFGQVLLGGGIGAFYITGYAAFQFYGLVPYVVAFAFMVSVTLLALVFALRQNGAVLALIGVLGGLGTPFLLGDDSGSMEGLVLYTALILLLVSFYGAWMVLLIGYTEVFDWRAAVSLSDKLVTQYGIAFAWSFPVLTAVTREVLRTRDPGRWSPLFLIQMPRESIEGERPARSNAPAHLVCVTAPLLALAFTSGIWDLSERPLGWISLGAAALYALAGLLVRRVENGGLMHYTQGLTALMLATLALVLLLDGNTLFMAFALEATALHFLARRLSDEIVGTGAHALFAVVFVWILGVLLGLGASPDYEGSFIIGPQALPALICISLLFAASFALVRSGSITAYRAGAHMALLGWIWREMSALPDGEVYVTIAWGVYAAALLVAGLCFDGLALRRTGMFTLFLVAGKLFLVDLAAVEPGWRILLFLGFGALFLALSYSLHKLWRSGTAGSVTARYPGRDELR